MHEIPNLPFPSLQQPEQAQLAQDLKPHQADDIDGEDGPNGDRDE